MSGTIVYIYKNGEAFEVEFMTLSGDTIAVETVVAAHVRPVERNEITHARRLVDR
jgi:hypothetical protein